MTGMTNTGPPGAGFAVAAPLHRGQFVVGGLCVFDAAPRRGGLDLVMRRLTGIAQRLDMESLRWTTPFDRLAELREAFDEDLITAVGHEIGTPLSVIQGHLELLGESAAGGDAVHRWQIEAMNRNLRRLCQSVDRLMLTAQI
jgi:signal transduction histidine kinase